MNARKLHRIDDGRVPQRGWAATAGLLLIALGAWGALVPFIGPYFDFAFTPDDPWQWTAARGWLSVLPGAVTIVAGVILVGSGRRGGAAFGGWLAVAGGTWLAIGPELADPLGIGALGTPTADSAAMRALEQLTYHELLGVVIVFLAAVTLGRHGGTRTLLTESPTAEAPPHREETESAAPPGDGRAVVIKERDERLAGPRGAYAAARREPESSEAEPDLTAVLAADDVADRREQTSSPVYGPVTADQAHRSDAHMSGRSDR